MPGQQQRNCLFLNRGWHAIPQIGNRVERGHPESQSAKRLGSSTRNFVRCYSNGLINFYHGNVSLSSHVPLLDQGDMCSFCRT